MEGVGGWWGPRRQSAVTTVWSLSWVLFSCPGTAHLYNPWVIWTHLQIQQCFYRCFLRARLYLWKYGCWVYFNAIHPLKNGSKVISACNLTASTSWINPTHLIICCCLFGLFLLSPLIICISLCFYKPFPNPKLDLMYTFFLTHQTTFPVNHIFLLLLSFPSISLILLPFLSFSAATNSTFISLSCLLFWCIETFLCFPCCWWYLFVLICSCSFPNFSHLPVTILCFRIK